MSIFTENKEFAEWWAEYSKTCNGLPVYSALDAWKAAKEYYSKQSIPNKVTNEMLEVGMDCFVFPIDNGRFSKHELENAFNVMIEAYQKESK